MNEAIGASELFVPHPYETPFEISEGITVSFRDAGHLLGSSSVIIDLTENDVKRRIVFSGDIGNINQPLIRDPQYIESADYVIMESTYGNRIHDRPTDYVTALANVLQKTFDKGGSVIIPSFAVGRTQEMLYFIRQIKSDKMIKGHDGFPVYVDSPLANEATDIFINNRESCYDEEALSFVRHGINPIAFDGLIRTLTSDDSRAINSDSRPKVIISASGMCEAGRIKHHLKHNLWKPENTILFVGYQAINTLGRSIVDGARKVKLFGETVTVSAKIQQLPGVSGHADSAGLMKWAESISGVRKFFINHGDSSSSETFAQKLRDELGADVYVPYSSAEFDITNGIVTVDAEPRPIAKKSQHSNENINYNNLIIASERLARLIQNSSGRTNADMRQLTDAINRLCDNWKL